jgi:hypothetical protein
MNPANSWRTWLGSRFLPAAIYVLSCLSAAIHAQSDPQLQFVKIVPSAPGTYGAPVRFGPGETLGLRVTGLPAQEGVYLQVQGLVNHDPSAFP